MLQYSHDTFTSMRHDRLASLPSTFCTVERFFDLPGQIHFKRPNRTTLYKLWAASFISSLKLTLFTSYCFRSRSPHTASRLALRLLRNYDKSEPPPQGKMARQEMTSFSHDSSPCWSFVTTIFCVCCRSSKRL